MALTSCQEEDHINKAPEIWQNIIPGDYDGHLEIFYEDQSLDMAAIKLNIQRIDYSYKLALNSKLKLSVETLTLQIISFENFEDGNGAIYFNIMENQFYNTAEVGAYKNVIYINQSGIDEMAKSNVEIRLCLQCLKKDSIRNIFINAKRLF